MYRLTSFHGTAATILKFIILFVVDFVGGLATSSALNAGSPVMAGVILAILLFLNYVYIFKAPTPLKFLAPGIVFLLTFVVVPIIYTVAMAGFNYKTGNEIGKEDVIVALESAESEVIGADGLPVSYSYLLGTTEATGDETVMLTAYTDPETFAISEVALLSQAGKQIVPEGSYQLDDFGINVVSAEGFTPLTPDEIAALGDKVLDLKYSMGDGTFVIPSDLVYANLVTIDYLYDAKTDTFTKGSTGDIYVDKGNGNFENQNDPKDKLKPGWRSLNFPDNFTGFFTDPDLRGPFFRVFLWTVVFAFLAVLTMFVVGLTLALAMDKPMRGRRIYRSILILPYAIPGFLSILIWRGMFNKDFGIINRLLMQAGLIDSNIGWFDGPWTARFVVLLVNLWLGFPYFYLISSGALQAIPQELKEAAEIDGATGWQAFRQVTLPLLLQILNPLLIASFAYNFNNFNIIYLLTGGGPKDELAGERAGATDILISYAYQTAVQDPSNQNFGLASAISLFMFVIVGVLSMVSLRQSKALEEF